VVTWGPTKNLDPIGSAVLTFIGYKQTDKQTDKPNLYIDGEYLIMFIIWFVFEKYYFLNVFLYLYQNKKIKDWYNYSYKKFAILESISLINIPKSLNWKIWKSY